MSPFNHKIIAQALHKLIIDSLMAVKSLSSSGALPMKSLLAIDKEGIQPCRNELKHCLQRISEVGTPPTSTTLAVSIKRFFKGPSE